MTDGDLVTLTQVAHTLKSAARSVGALALGEICQAIEDAVRAQDQARYSALAHDVSSALAGAVQRINAHLAS
jgi:HPt (histidine-containing phosphotransfer) domain-containing protein